PPPSAALSRSPGRAAEGPAGAEAPRGGAGPGRETDPTPGRPAADGAGPVPAVMIRAGSVSDGSFFRPSLTLPARFHLVAHASGSRFHLVAHAFGSAAP